ncbi:MULTISPECIES: adenosylcobinamide-GDP ribazoletransferase [unclassified Roseovarius]|uniref:adenosylcobinamide-GDP ribazoletransferase n=1 Tax=unclassified Roseovarius TaxID=2614913 RepID=UPI00273D0600|nr:MULTISPECIES: adenosylcobinamide-GDP ribazoletransferase [unclassified Roseovarius]
MVKNDTPPPTPSDVVEALALLTRLPVPAGDSARGAAAAWAYPLVGVVIGGIAAVAGAIAYWLALPPLLCALLSLATMIVLTGAMHEDGLADTADGLWGGWTREARLEIMKDSHIGTYGVLALILSFAARWGALWLLFEAGVGLACAALIVGAAVSRGAMPALMAYLPHARDTGLSQSVGSASPATAWIAGGIAALVALLFAGASMFGVVIWAVVLTLAIAMVARRKVGGQTGDILGACQQITEIAVLWSLLA